MRDDQQQDRWTLKKKPEDSEFMLGTDNNKQTVHCLPFISSDAFDPHMLNLSWFQGGHQCLRVSIGGPERAGMKRTVLAPGV